mmetsp:Transcript_14537/g.20653  ORF Transcript_14537/g.20653 Transcript_14537/m.20653 type:complete len:208 (-) Transcript_14537:378-1001(-)
MAPVIPATISSHFFLFSVVPIIIIISISSDLVIPQHCQNPVLQHDLEGNQLCENKQKHHQHRIDLGVDCLVAGGQRVLQRSCQRKHPPTHPPSRPHEQSSTGQRLSVQAAVVSNGKAREGKGQEHVEGQQQHRQSEVDAGQHHEEHFARPHRRRGRGEKHQSVQHHLTQVEQCVEDQVRNQQTLAVDHGAEPVSAALQKRLCPNDGQ